MRSLAAIVAVLAASIVTPGSAAEFACPKGTEDFLTPIKWSATVLDVRSVEVRLGVRNPTDKGIQLVEATAYFIDGLERLIGSYRLNPALQIAPSDGNIDRQILGDSFDAGLATLPTTSVTICTEAILFADGTKQAF